MPACRQPPPRACNQTDVSGPGKAGNLAPALGDGDQLSGADENRADRSAQALGGSIVDRKVFRIRKVFTLLKHICTVSACAASSATVTPCKPCSPPPLVDHVSTNLRHGRIKNACAIHVNGQVMLVSQGPHRPSKNYLPPPGLEPPPLAVEPHVYPTRPPGSLEVLDGEGLAAGVVVRILEADEAGRRHVRVLRSLSFTDHTKWIYLEPDGAADLIKGQLAIDVDGHR